MQQAICRLFTIHDYNSWDRLIYVHPESYKKRGRGYGNPTTKKKKQDQEIVPSGLSVRHFLHYENMKGLPIYV